MRIDERDPEQFEDRLLSELRSVVVERQAPAPRPARRRPLGLALAVGAAAGVAFAVLSVGDRTPLRSGPDWADAALRVANSVPRLSIDQPGWKVVRADEFSVDQGEMTFSDGRHSVELSWREGARHRAYVEDRARDNERLDEAEVAGARAQVFAYRGTENDYTALWRSGDYSLELRTGFSNPEDRLAEQAFRRVLTSLKAVDVDTWLASMPESVVRPDARGATVAEMLEGIPVPDGFDRKRLAAGDAVKDRYQLGAQVTSAVACAWIRQWLGARRSGDERAAAEAVAAMENSRKWPILLEMNAAGDYPEVLWEYADAMSGDGTVPGGRMLTVAESYQDGLGC